MDKFGTLSANAIVDDTEMLDAICQELNISLTPDMRDEIHGHLWQKCGDDLAQHEDAKINMQEHRARWTKASRAENSVPEPSRFTHYLNKKRNRESSERCMAGAMYREIEIYRTLLRMQLNEPLNLQQAPWQNESWKKLVA